MNIKWIWRTKGLSARFKMIWLIIFSLLASFWFYYDLWWWDRVIDIFFLEWGKLWVGLWFIPIFMFMIIATSNSVNLSDGLDGLAGGLLLFLLLSLCLYYLWSVIIFFIINFMCKYCLSSTCFFMVWYKTCKNLYVRCLKFGFRSQLMITSHIN